MKKFVALAALAAVVCPAWAFDYYLKIDTIEGESTEETHDGWIDVQGWGWGVSSAPSSGTGGGRSRAVFDDFSWQQGVDRSVVALFLGVATGEQFATATLDVVAPGDRPRTFFQMIFEDVQLSRLAQQGAGAPLGAQAAFGYESVSLRYRQLGPRGGFIGDWVEGSFDLQSGGLAFAGNPQVIEGLLLSGGSVELAALAPAVPEPAGWALLTLGLVGLGAAVRRR